MPSMIERHYGQRQIAEGSVGVMREFDLSI
jgi:hypothetical protein